MRKEHSENGMKRLSLGKQHKLFFVEAEISRRSREKVQEKLQ